MADFKLNVVKGFSLRVNAAGVTVEKKINGTMSRNNLEASFASTEFEQICSVCT